MVRQALVLLSGGMDSVAALHWAHAKYRDSVAAFLFDYGQPNRDQELTAAGALARELGVPTRTFVIADALPARGILKAVVDDDGRSDGLSPAFVPGRNALFLASAAAHGSVYFPNGSFDIVIAANGQDARRFPDCTSGGLLKMAQALRHCLAREIGVVAPFVDQTKEQILRSLGEQGRKAVARSWSCYRNRGPCGKCSACVLRRDAFAAVGLEDRCAEARLSGGDPSREAR